MVAIDSVTAACLKCLFAKLFAKTARLSQDCPLRAVKPSSNTLTHPLTEKTSDDAKDQGRQIAALQDIFARFKGLHGSHRTGHEHLTRQQGMP